MKYVKPPNRKIRHLTNELRGLLAQSTHFDHVERLCPKVFHLI